MRILNTIHLKLNSVFAQLGNRSHESASTAKEYAIGQSEAFVSLCKELALMVKMYDQMASQMPNGEAKDLAEDFSGQIITTLSLCDGCTAIINEPTFDAHRHTPVPFSMVEDGTPIQSFVRMGIALGEQVIIPAKVKVSED